MVYGTYNYSYWGESKPTNITGGGHIVQYMNYVHNSFFVTSWSSQRNANLDHRPLFVRLADLRIRMEYKREVGFHYHSQKNNKNQQVLPAVVQLWNLPILMVYSKISNSKSSCYSQFQRSWWSPKFYCWFAPHLMTMVSQKHSQPDHTIIIRMLALLAISPCLSKFCQSIHLFFLHYGMVPQNRLVYHDVPHSNPILVAWRYTPFSDTPVSTKPLTTPCNWKLNPTFSHHFWWFTPPCSLEYAYPSLLTSQWWFMSSPYWFE